MPADTIQNGIFSGLDWFPTFVAAAGNPNIAEELLKGKQIGDKTYKVHLDGYNQMDAITGKGPSARHEIFYFTEGTLARRADRRLQVSLHRSARRLAGRHGQGGLADSGQPPSRSRSSAPACPTAGQGSLAYYNWFVNEFWRFVFVQQEVAKYAQTFLEYPPMQEGASFNMSALKAELEKKMEQMQSSPGK